MPQLHSISLFPAGADSRSGPKRRAPAALALVLALALVSASASGTAGAADLQLTVTGGPSAASTLYVSLFDSAETMAADRKVASQAVPMQDGTAQVVFRGLAAGRYAVWSFADENGNGKLDTNLVGMPTERYGFSNDARGRFGPPGFDSAAVPVHGDTKSAFVVK